jgi:hypothetical protein
VAGVTVVVINLRSKNKAKKYIYDNLIRAEVDHINAYLSNGADIIITKRPKPLSAIPKMGYGCKPVDGGFLIFNTATKDEAIAEDPRVANFVKKFVSGQDYLSNNNRWCLWISDAEFEDAYKIPFVKERVDEVRAFRLKSKDTGAQAMAKKPYQFREFVMPPSNSIIMPSTSSERREYIPCGYIPADTVPNNASFVIPTAPTWLFGLICSKMHVAWVRAICGKLKTDYRYSSTLGYNTFPIPTILDYQKQEIESKVRSVLFARENYTEKTLSDMYDPDHMPEDLRQAHHELDLAIDRLYRPKPYSNDEERLADLFSLYEQMTKAEKEKTK